MILSRSSITICALLLTFPLSAATSTGPPRPEKSGSLSATVRAVVAATSGDAVGDGDEIERRLLEVIDAVKRRMGEGRPTHRRALRLHRMLQRRYLHRYEEDADGIREILDDGRYNCLSATLFYGLIARALGYDAWVLERPGHLLLRLKLKRRVVDIETTSPRGFHVASLYAASAEFGQSPFAYLEAREEVATPLLHRSRDAGRYREISLDETVGFAWLNAAWRALEQGNPDRAADLAVQAGRLLPRTRHDRDDLRRLLSRAFLEEYEAGRFASAYRIAKIDVGLHPSLTTSRDRILAAAMKRVEAACDGNRPDEAQRIVDEVESICDDPPGLSRLGRRALPLIAAAAVRLGEWDLARRAVERYSRAELDPVESSRLADWVESRASQAGLDEPEVCLDTRDEAGECGAGR